MSAPAPGATLRPARAADLAAVEALLRESELPLDGVADALPNFMVAEADRELVGVAGLEPYGEDALLRSVAVRAVWRGRGVGRRLVGRVIADAEARGVRALYLLTTSAEAWFPSLGFARVEREEVSDAVRQSVEFRGACPATAVVMRRSLRAAV